ncbi:MAG: Bro-N domain-containing protein [Patescibacteria group bacterium]|nr:Bro-N domain-containing protein [Patescibacteria group bacterium]
MPNEIKIAIFKGKKIRKIIHQNEWWFSVIDVCEALTDSVDAGAYWRKLKQRLSEEGSEVVTFCHGLKMKAPDGKMRETDCADTEGVFRIIQSIPSPKAEPFKRWLAKVGYERIQEIAIREELMDEWNKRGAKERKEYEILTAEISKATFGLTPSQYKKHKNLKRENLRDHMDDFELIFSMLGEKSTTEIHRTENSQGVPKLKADAKSGGDIAGGARKKLEKRLGRSVVSKNNFKPLGDRKKLSK